MTKTVAVCDKCGKSIEGAKGISIQGNIYVAGTDQGGLIGNGLSLNGIPTPECVPYIDYCAACFLQGMTKEFRQELKEYLEIKLR